MTDNIKAIRDALAEHVQFNADGKRFSYDTNEWRTACMPDRIASLLDALELAQAQLAAANHELSEIHQGLTNPNWFTNGPRAAHMHALNWSYKSAERRAAAMKGQA